VPTGLAYLASATVLSDPVLTGHHRRRKLSTVKLGRQRRSNCATTPASHWRDAVLRRLTAPVASSCASLRGGASCRRRPRHLTARSWAGTAGAGIKPGAAPAIPAEKRAPLGAPLSTRDKKFLAVLASRATSRGVAGRRRATFHATELVVGSYAMVPVALAVLLNRGAVRNFSRGGRPGGQRCDTDGCDCDGELTHERFSLSRSGCGGFFGLPPI